MHGASYFMRWLLNLFSPLLKRELMHDFYHHPKHKMWPTKITKIKCLSWRYSPELNLDSFLQAKLCLSELETMFPSGYKEMCFSCPSGFILIVCRISFTKKYFLEIRIWESISEQININKHWCFQRMCRVLSSVLKLTGNVADRAAALLTPAKWWAIMQCLISGSFLNSKEFLKINVTARCVQMLKSAPGLSGFSNYVPLKAPVCYGNWWATGLFQNDKPAPKLHLIY